MPTLVPRDLDARFVNALQAEFLGTALLQFMAALSGTSWGYGFSYAALGASNLTLPSHQAVSGTSSCQRQCSVA